MFVFSFLFVWAEVSRWWDGYEEHNFAVEKGVGHELQVNLDIVVNMQCQDLHINVQDAAGDRILAASKLNRDRTNWSTWADRDGVHQLGHDSEGRINTGAGWRQIARPEEGFGEEHIHDIVRQGKKSSKWAKTPRVRGKGDSCRVYGSLDLNKVKGDFHITARGHGYMEMGEHLDHSSTSLTPLPDINFQGGRLTHSQSSTSPTSSRSSRTAPSTRRSSTPSTAPSTPPSITSTCSSTTSRSCRPSTRTARAPSRRTSTP